MAFAFPSLFLSSSPLLSLPSVPITFTRMTSGLWFEALNFKCSVSSPSPAVFPCYHFAFIQYACLGILKAMCARQDQLSVSHNPPESFGPLVCETKIMDERILWGATHCQCLEFMGSLWWCGVVECFLSCNIWGPFSWLFNTCMTVDLQKSPSFVGVFFSSSE